MCVALGNRFANEEKPTQQTVAVLVDALSDPEPLVRGHAAWALGRVNGAPACSPLEAARASEGDPWVREELAFALGR
jgi:epoxyqueuosine reductase